MERNRGAFSHTKCSSGKLRVVRIHHQQKRLPRWMWVCFIWEFDTGDIPTVRTVCLYTGCVQQSSPTWHLNVLFW